MTPAILLRDADLIKKVLIDNYDCFSENYWTDDENYDQLMKNWPFHKTIDEWENSRKKFSSPFTSEKVLQFEG